jgi:putative SOS response-associated peptidase YedK
MCNLYSMRRSRDGLVKLFGITRVGNDVHFDLPDIYPDQMAPVIKQDSGGQRVLTTMRCGFPPPPNLGTRPVTNYRLPISSGSLAIAVAIVSASAGERNRSRRAIS